MPGPSMPRNTEAVPAFAGKGAELAALAGKGSELAAFGGKDGGKGCLDSAAFGGKGLEFGGKGLDLAAFGGKGLDFGGKGLDFGGKGLDLAAFGGKGLDLGAFGTKGSDLAAFGGKGLEPGPKIPGMQGGAQVSGILSAGGKGLAPLGSSSLPPPPAGLNLAGMQLPPGLTPPAMPKLPIGPGMMPPGAQLPPGVLPPGMMPPGAGGSWNTEAIAQIRFQQVASQYDQAKNNEIDPQVQELAEHHSLDDRAMRALDEEMKKRKDTFESDMQALWVHLEGAKNPSGKLMMKLKEMRMGVFKGMTALDKTIQEFAKKNRLDAQAAVKLAEAMENRTDLEGDLAKLAKHFERSNKPSSLAMMMLRDLREGKPVKDPEYTAAIGSKIHEKEVREQLKERKNRSRSRERGSRYDDGRGERGGRDYRDRDRDRGDRGDRGGGGRDYRDREDRRDRDRDDRGQRRDYDGSRGGSSR
eukprot:TRINITY_DN4135_c0_g1_i2.p1 TRINITY_DN4135_c0_g1~~TRINITY_DN4135_c0_g1_i2.p1  ORF type:complete len:537 (+),score=105.63 TRINITY_DN4135_c0_g1_i2:207-1613(+)